MTFWNRSPRRVVIFTETFLPRVDGIVNTLKHALNGLVAEGWEPLVVAPSGNTQPLPGVQVIGAPSIVFPLYPEVRLAYPTPDVWRQLDAFGPDVVHLAGPVTNGFGGLKYAQARGLPVISSYHTALPQYARLYGLEWMVEWSWARLREVHNATHATLCPSLSTISELEGRGFQRLQLWARGVNGALFRPRARCGSARRVLGADDDAEVVVLFVGRLAREKKLDRLAAAAARVPGVRVALVGDGPDRARLERVFADADVRTTFTGVLQGQALADAYGAADVFAFPSDTDTFGNVVLEAMACGLPVVASSVGGQVDLVSPGVSGFLFAPEDVAGFAALLAQYRDNVALRLTHGAAGLLLARERNWDHLVEQLIGYYEAAIRATETTRAPALTAA